MTSSRSWRRLFAVPLAISLALGGALLAAAPAYAAAPLITSPTSGATVGSRTVAFTGTADAGARVGLSATPATPLAGPVTADGTTGAWSLTYTFPADAATAQSLAITSVSPVTGAIESTPITITLPAPVPAQDPTPGTGFTLTTPNDNSINPTRTVIFSGTAPDGAFVGVADENGVLFADPVGVGESGTYSFPVTFPDSVGFRQTVVVGAYLGDVLLGEFTRTVGFAPTGTPTGPTDPNATPFTVSGPDTVSLQLERVVTFTGTAPAGSLVAVVDETQAPLAEPVLVGESGVYSIDVDFTDADGLVVPVAVVAAYQNQILGPITRVVIFAPSPEDLLAAPVITTPATESTVTGPTVTFTGTATAGETVYVGVAPAATAAEAPSLATLLGPAVVAALVSGAPVNAETLQAAIGDSGFIRSAVVGADGTFAVTLPLVDGLYTASAVTASFTSTTDFTLSAPSNVVNFAVGAAAVVPVPPTATPAPIAAATPKPAVKPVAAKRTTLAATGSESEGVIGLGVLLLLAGAGTMVVRRRLRSAQHAE